MVNIDFTKYNHIILIGNSGSGKSWLSKRIAEITGYPLYHLDVEFWKPGWIMTANDEKISRQQEIINSERWIIDGNYNSTIDLRMAAADLVIFLDISRLVCIWSAAMRTGKKRSDLPNYLEEPKMLSKEFFEFCKWIWSFRKTGRKKIMDLRDKHPDVAFLHIRSRREVKRLTRRF